ncbi:MAG: hypothetical protein IJ679_01915 [Lachnospiraceae bacterium]|nr:hypothetical protein [Lachnospiraceae bacterium]
MEKDSSFEYRVLFVQTVKQEKLQDVFRKNLPAERGRVFVPMMEYYRRDKKAIDTKPLFPGYLFIQTDLRRRELHEFIKSQSFDIQAAAFEISFRESRNAGEERYWDEDVFDMKDLLPEEADFLDHMLDEEGLLHMSVGYKEKDRIFVMEGPLRYYQDRIVDVDRHNRRAYLNFEFMGRVIQAGLELVPRRRFFPDEPDTSEILEDGSEVDLSELKNRMMGG